MNLLGSGKEGNVYLLQNKKIIKHRKVNSDDKEYKIQHILYQIVPESIIRPIDQFRTLNGKPIFLMDYLNAKPIKELITNPQSFKDFPTIMIELLCKVMKILDKIHTKLPSFRHNDLHVENVMVTEDKKVYIHDFGYSRVDIPGVNHMKIFNNSGIVPHNDIRYDYHYFLNTCHYWSPQNSKLRKIIEAVLPPEYLTHESEFVNRFRLRPNMEYPGLPSRSKLVKIFCVK